MRNIILLAALTLAACASTTKIRTAEGGDGYALTCSGTARTWASCLERAGEACPHGYEVLERSSDTGWAVAGNAGGSTNSRSMVVRCR